MINIYPASQAHQFDRGWVRGHHLFSFGDHYDPNNTEFGPMRVFNNDVIIPGRGFGAHPHSDMEIVSIVLSGQLRHEDSLGNVAITSYGGVQRMTAGSGVIHTEHNSSEDEEVNLLQLWFMPHTKGLTPSYTTSSFNPEEMSGKLLAIVSHTAAPGVVDVHQDMTIYLSSLEPGQELTFNQKQGRRIFLFVIDGQLKVQSEHVLGMRDSARIEDVLELSLVAVENSRFMLIDLP